MMESSIQHKDYEYHSSTYHVPLVKSQCNSFNLYYFTGFLMQIEVFHVPSILEPNFLEFRYVNPSNFKVQISLIRSFN